MRLWILQDSAESEKITELKISDIEPTKGQPRKDFDEEKLTELEDTLFDDSIEQKLAEKASEIEAALNAKKDGFFAEFENAHKADIESIEEALLAKKQQLKSEIEQGN